MRIKHGLISCDSHGQLDRDAFTTRMSKAKWAGRIPEVVELEHKGKLVERWVVDGKPWMREVVNCPAAMPGRGAQRYPDRWEDVPRKVYDPVERLEAIDEDGVDGEVLFPNTPFGTGAFSENGEAEFELACVRAYNEALGEWRQFSEQYIPLMMIPYMSPIEVVVAEVGRASEIGCRGVAMQAEPAGIKGSHPLADPFWDPFWEVCQDLGLPINWHAGGGGKLWVPHWEGYTRAQHHTVFTGRIPAGAGQAVAYLLFCGILDRFPRLKFALAETGTGWMAYVLEACDHEWERRHLWTEGVLTRPSELFRQHIYTSFWFEQSGIELRDYIGVDNIMWESDYPHITSTYPRSREHVERTVSGVPPAEREKLLYKNALRLYGLAD